MRIWCVRSISASDAFAIFVERGGFDFAGHEEVRDGGPALRGALGHEAAERAGHFDASGFLAASVDAAAALPPPARRRRESRRPDRSRAQRQDPPLILWRGGAPWEKFLRCDGSRLRPRRGCGRSWGDLGFRAAIQPARPEPSIRSRGTVFRRAPRSTRWFVRRECRLRRALIPARMPSAGASTSTTALSVSISRSGSPLVTRSPSFFRQAMSLPVSCAISRAGMTTLKAIVFYVGEGPHDGLQPETPTRSVFALASIISSTRSLGEASVSRVVGSGPFTVK